jgi:hypothetical protein
MDAPDQKVVTLASLRPPSSAAESVEPPEASTPEAEFKRALYGQIMQRLQDATDEVGGDVMVTAQDREVSLAQSRIADLATETRRLDSGGQEVQFGTGITGFDWFRWMWSLTDWVGRKDAHPLVRPPHAMAEQLTGDLTVAMTADWATGLYGAPRIADTIRTMAADRPFDLLMHLGDVYYSGTPEEVDERFLRLWPSAAGRRNRALNGNHDMYSGGFGYFERILPAFSQSGSYFAVQNEHWVLVGLDTAYVDHDIDTIQVAWLNLVLRRAEVPRRKVVLFSHQQPFSRLSHQGPKLQSALRHLLDRQAVTAWYWGHEHQCVIYGQHEKWGLYGRCLGNGGVPEPRRAEVKAAPADERYPGAAECTWRRLEPVKGVPGCIALDGPNRDMVKPVHQKRFVPHGFMTLEFAGPELVERVHLSDGTELFRNTIS